jgi:uncharacterized protein YkwD
MLDMVTKDYLDRRGGGNGMRGTTQTGRGVRRLAGAAMVAIMLAGPGSATASTTANEGRGDVHPRVHARAQDRNGMYRLTNTSRTHRGIRALDLAARMSELARRHSQKMAARGSLFHTVDPVSTYLRGRRWRVWGENVGMTGGTLSNMQQLFMGSPPHRHNILNSQFRDCAVGVVRVDGVKWVTVFFYG